jgi:hypothetical protein
MVGLVASLSVASASHAATVQITLSGNGVTFLAGNQLQKDLTGDGLEDVASWRGSQDGDFLRLADYYDGINSEQIAAVFGSDRFGQVGNQSFFSSGTPAAAEGLVAVHFSDERINGGDVTAGWVDVRSYWNSENNFGIELQRLIFNDAATASPVGVSAAAGAYAEFSTVSAVPEPSSQLALIALGSAGVLTRRRLKRKA